MSATGFVVGRFVDHGERIAACDTCRPAVEALTSRRGLIGIRWEPVRPPIDYVSYGERRPYVLVDRLDELSGPTCGVVRLPNHLDWSGNPSYDLDNSDSMASLYRSVLREAQQVDDLRMWLSADHLLRLWPHLYLPPKVRRIWEERFPALTATRAVAA